MRKELKGIGLSDKEIDLYLAGLRSGKATAQQLAESSQIKRATVYFIVDSLKKQGLINQTFKNRKKVFEMSPPEKFLKIVKKEKTRIQKQERDIMKIVSNLKAMAKKPELSTDVKLYEGYESTMDILIELGKTKKPTYSFYSSHFFPIEDYEKIKKTIAEFNKVKRMAKSKLYVITDYLPLTSKFFPLADEDIREFRFLPRGIKLPAMVDVSDDKVTLTSVQGDYNCIVIQNITIAETLKIMHNIIWESLKKE